MGELSKAELLKLVQAQKQRLAEQEAEIKILRQKIDLLAHKIFGKSSEKLDPQQLQMLFEMEKSALGKSEASLGLEDDKEAETRQQEAKRSKRVRDDRAERLPSNLPVVEEVLIPEPVRQDPENWRMIGEEVSEQLDYEPARFFRRRLVRKKYVHKKEWEAAPLIAPLPPVLQERCIAAPGLLAQIVVSKYCDHLPLYRQESIYQSRHGITLSRQNMCRWIRLTADWLKPIYEMIRTGVMEGGYVQVDETPIRYLAPGKGETELGYLWTSCRPGGYVYFHWQTSREGECLDRIIPVDFTGTLQSDGYVAYSAFARRREGKVRLAGCWAHARRKFHEAREQAPQMAAFILKQIQILYKIEETLRKDRAGANLRSAKRAAESQWVYKRIGRLLKRLSTIGRYLPSSLMGKAIRYALRHWKQLGVYLSEGRVEIDNNLVENCIRPTAVGKKNWLFFGEAEAGERSAIIYTIVENCRRLEIDPFTYLRDVLHRLPRMTNWQVKDLLPHVWIKAQKAAPIALAA